MDLTTEFAHLTERAIAVENYSGDKVKVSLNLPVREVFVANRLASALGITRQDVISKIFVSGLPDAVRGYFQIIGDNALDSMPWEEFCALVGEGEYF